MANKARGLIEIEIGQEKFQVSLNLGALAELESEFGVESFEEALDFGDKISATKLRKFLHALLKGNGVDMTPERQRNLDLFTPAEFMETLGTLLATSGMTKQEGVATESASGPLADQSAGEPG